MNYSDPKMSKGQVERLARFYYRKIQSVAGASLSLEDLEQEFWLVWHMASQRFDASRGFAFEAFLGVSIKNKAMELSRFHAKRYMLSANSVDETIGDSGNTLVDLIEDETGECPDDRLVREENVCRVLENIDPRLRRIVEFLENTPRDIEREVEAVRAKAAYAESLGFSMRAPKDVTVTMLSDLMGISRCVRYRMIEQIQEVCGD